MNFDFLGWVHFTDHRVLRAKTKRRMLVKLNRASETSVASYKGLLKHGNMYKLSEKLFGFEDKMY
ncbi:MAG: hypothetical protein HYX22_00250 [Candidatus Yanofskybacteria bacterium]|nr:hypothetical protein [Candidatus Yanofskybacteria bacterium]